MARPYEERAAWYRALLAGSPALAPLAGALPVEPGSPGSVVAGLVLAPVLGDFTQWLLAQAKERGTRRLYFLARDGYYVFRAAEALNRALGLGLDCRYLYCSRRALGIPLFHLDRRRGLDALCRGGMDLTLDQVLARAGLSPEERRQAAGELGLPFSLAQRLPKRALPQVRQALGQSPVFLNLAGGYSRKALPGLVGYLEQEGLLEDLPWALVDSGWMGSLQRGLQQVLQSRGRGRPLEGYYFGLYQIPKGMDPRRFHGYAFTPAGPRQWKMELNNCVFEAVFAAPHGTALGYRQVGGRWAPVLERWESHPLGEWLGRCLDRCTPALVQLCGERGLVSTEASRDRALRLFAAFCHTPWPQEAAVFGRLPFSDGAGEAKPLAAPLAERELWLSHSPARLLAQAVAASPGRESAWPQGTAALSARVPQLCWEAYRWYQALRFFKMPPRG